MTASTNKIILAGGSGFLGRALAAHFRQAGREVVILSRAPRPAAGGVRERLWDARTLGEWLVELEDATAVINLTGKSVNCRYTSRNRAEILDSRVDATRVLGEAIGRCAQPPRVWLNAGAATIYPQTFDHDWDEQGELDRVAEAEDPFSVEVALVWENALEQARTPGTRKVVLRLAMVLGQADNSVFPVLRRLVRLGLGGRMGSGRQFVSWIHVADFCRAVEWLIAHETIAGPVNLTAPGPVTNTEMMRTLRQLCRVPLGLPAAAWMLEIGALLLRTETELILKSRRVIPGALLASGFHFQFPTIRKAFADLLAGQGRL